MNDIKNNYKKVLIELLEEQYNIPDDDICGCCGIIGYINNCCNMCNINVCEKCDDKILFGVYNSRYDYIGTYGFIACPSCYHDIKQNKIKKYLNKNN